MQTQSRVSRMIPATSLKEGAGVTVYRTIGTSSLRNYDPFLMLDYFASDNPDDYIAGFPSHPHRGFSTFTYMIDGCVEHRDSMANAGILGPGGAQLMKAASGVIHSEMPKQENGLMRGFQLWINLPAKHKMDTPEYQEYNADAFPVVESDTYRVKVLMGQFQDEVAPIVDEITRAFYFDIELKKTRSVYHEVNPDYNNFLYLFEGSGTLNGHKVPHNHLVAIGADDCPIEFVGGPEGARFLLVGGKPINEEIVQYGPFVMNSQEEIDQAMRDLQTDNFVRRQS